MAGLKVEYLVLQMVEKSDELKAVMMADLSAR